MDDRSVVREPCICSSDEGNPGTGSSNVGHHVGCAASLAHATGLFLASLRRRTCVWNSMFRGLGDCVGFQQVEIRQHARLDKWHDLGLLLFLHLGLTNVALSMSPPRRARNKVKGGAIKTGSLPKHAVLQVLDEYLVSISCLPSSTAPTITNTDRGFLDS
jgi:hypothetical protein